MRPLLDLADFDKALCCVEVHADSAGDFDSDHLRRCHGVPLVYLIDRRSESLDSTQRQRRLVAAAQRYVLVDLDAD